MFSRLLRAILRAKKRMTWLNFPQRKTGDKRSHVHVVWARFKAVADLDISGTGKSHPHPLILDETEAQKVPSPCLSRDLDVP